MKIASKNTSFHSYSDSELVSVPVTSPMLAKEWTIALSYEIEGQIYLFLFKKSEDGKEKNAYIFKINSDGSLGKTVCSEYWPETWTTGLTYKVSESSYLFLLNSGSNKNNVCIFKVTQDGFDGFPTYRDNWTKGWTSALTYTVENSQYLFLLKESGCGSDGNNVNIQRIDAGGKIPYRGGYNLSEGWTNALIYKFDNTQYLFLLMKSGYDSDGKNVCIYRITGIESIDGPVIDYRWSEGWTTALTYTVENSQYLFLLKESGYGSDGNNVHIHKINPADGTIGDRVASYKWSEGWRAALTYRQSGNLFLLLFRKPTTSESSDNVLIRRIDKEGKVVSEDSGQTIISGLTYQVYPHFHPYVGRLMKQLLRDEGVSKLQAADTKYVINEQLPDGKPRPELYEEFFGSRYQPTLLVSSTYPPYPVKELDFSEGSAYSVYNWELFFHAPLMIAMHLSKNQRFAEAQQWFHYLFDPTDDSNGSTPERFWKVRPFQDTDVHKIEEILVNLITGDDKTLQTQTTTSIEAWKKAPFRPHVIARFRQQAYMYKTVMAYLDNLIAWGDSLFRQDTGEAIDEAMMLYVLAANILGPRPQPVPKKGSVRPQNYANMRIDLQKGLDTLDNVQRDLEAYPPFDLAPFPVEATANGERLAIIRNLGKALYFCVPRNDKLLGYWDTVADRLFKIRNSLNFQGIFRQVPLFEPPIDPALLARAAAAGLDVGAIVNGLNQPLPLVRFQLLVQKAAEICQEVKSLGNNLLSAMEKEDNETLALLRAKHERIVLEMVEHVKYGQLQEAIKSKEGLFKSLALTVQKYIFYERQLGRKPDEIVKAIPELGELDKDSLVKLKLLQTEPEMSLREIDIDIAGDLEDSKGKIISSHEREELSNLKMASWSQIVASGLDATAAWVAMIPQYGTKFQPMGMGGEINFGGQHYHSMTSSLAAVARGFSGECTYDANNAGKIGGYARREQDWAFQSNLAAGEINQIFKQLRAAQIREAIAESELKNHGQQIENAKEVEHFLNEEGTEKTGKKTNKSLYAWMKREVKGLYGQCFQFAFDIAKKAERALQHELGNPDLSYLQFGYLAGKEGLLAGEKLYLDIKRMEMAYHEQNQREYELTKHVSLLQVDPLALIRLRTTGRCTVTLPEALFDMDCPGHYFRRIKTVAVSIPCVTGPYASVNCTLTLLKSSIRKTPVVGEGYKRTDAEDSRFNDHFGSLQSIVTSSAQNDSGMFETNLRDERYLPFENSGVISEWQLELPADPSKEDNLAQFDYDTISDVILHIRYTAREGGELLRKGAVDNLQAAIKEAKAAGLVRLFSVRHEFPTEWASFKSQTPGADQQFELALNLRSEHYPYWSQGYLKSVTRVDILARRTEKKLDIFDKANKNEKRKDTLNKDRSMGDLLVRKLTNEGDGIALPSPVGDLKLFFEDRTFDDLWIAITWSA